MVCSAPLLVFVWLCLYVLGTQGQAVMLNYAGEYCEYGEYCDARQAAVIRSQGRRSQKQGLSVVLTSMWLGS